MIKIKRGTRAQLNTAAAANQLAQGQQYLITDESIVAVGLSASTYAEVSGTVGGLMNSAYSQNTGENSLGTSEAQLGHVAITIKNASSKVLVIARVSLTKDTGTTARTATIRCRRGTSNSDTQVGRDSVVQSSTTASSAYYGVATIVAQDSPGATGSVTYSVRGLVGAGASTSAYELMVVELLAPKGDQGDQGIPGTIGQLDGFTAVGGTSHTVATTDQGKDVVCTNAASIALNIDTEANSGIAAGFCCLFSQGGAGAVTATALSGVTLRAPNGAATTSQYDIRGLEYLGSDVWRVL